MIRTALPDPSAHAPAGEAKAENSAIWASTTGKYFYPAHQTPYLLVANRQNPGDYRLNKQAVSATDRTFLFLNEGDRLEIGFATKLPRQTCLVMFDTVFVNRAIHSQLSSSKELLENPSSRADKEFHIPSIPFYLNQNIRERLDLIKDYSGRGLAPDEDSFFELVTEFALLNEDTARQIGKIGAVKRSTREELYKRLTIARAYIEDNACDQLSIGQIAKHACLNEFHFLRSFKKTFATTPHQYILKLKLEKAALYLKEKKYSVTEVCTMVGFESAGTFSNLFSRKFGVPPSSLLR